jgi:iron complex outermembrane receptor protein
MRWISRGAASALLLVTTGAFLHAAEPASAKPPAAVHARAEDAEHQAPVQLSEVEVRVDRDGDGFDATGMGSHEQQLLDAPFTNDLVLLEAVDDPVLDDQLQQIANPSPVDLATGDARINLRGFPTPILRNGFVTMGANDMLNTGRTVVIQGALVPVMGRAAPGGIQDFWTNRPRTSPGRRFDYSRSSLHNQSAGAEFVGVTVPKMAWHRVALNWNRRTGPEQFSATETRTAHGSVSWRHTKTSSTLWAFDYQQVHANVSQGVPEYRLAPGAKIIGPYRPLAAFNAFGPDAGVRRRTAAWSFRHHHSGMVLPPRSLERIARAGLVARAVVYLVIGLLATGAALRV